MCSPSFQTPPAIDWKEFTAPDGRKYYYNKATKESKWTLPDEMKAAAAATAAATGAPATAVLAPSVVQVVKAEPKLEVVEEKPEVKAQPKVDPTGKHMYATKVRRASLRFAPYLCIQLSALSLSL